MALTTEQVQEKMNNGAIVINVLGEMSYNILHIKGSINIPLKENEEEFVKEVEEKAGKDKEIITHCSGPGCNMGPAAARILKSHGFNAEDYPGGIEEWHKAGLPVEGEQA